jgi:hypothetical protein
MDLLIALLIPLLALAAFLLVLNMPAIADWRRSFGRRILVGLAVILLVGAAAWIFVEDEEAGLRQSRLAELVLGMTSTEVGRLNLPPTQSVERDINGVAGRVMIFDRERDGSRSTLIVVFVNERIGAIIETCPWDLPVHGIRCRDSAQQLAERLGEPTRVITKPGSTRQQYRYDRLQTGFFLNQGKVFMVQRYGDELADWSL